LELPDPDPSFTKQKEVLMTSTLMVTRGKREEKLNIRGSIPLVSYLSKIA
jgi:hypothetical protein